jgi:hypothetical protein
MTSKVITCEMSRPPAAILRRRKFVTSRSTDPRIIYLAPRSEQMDTESVTMLGG